MHEMVVPSVNLSDGSQTYRFPATPQLLRMQRQAVYYSSRERWTRFIVYLADIYKRVANNIGTERRRWGQVVKLKKQFNYSLMKLGRVFLDVIPQTLRDDLLFKSKYLRLHFSGRALHQ